MNRSGELAKILSDMGETAATVALTLRGAGVQGVRNTVRFLNPVVRYCQAQLRLDDYSLGLIHRDILRMSLPNGRTVEVQLPPSVRNFLDAFNRGAFPDLVLPAS